MDDYYTAQINTIKQMSELVKKYNKRTTTQKTRGHLKAFIQRLEEYFNTFNSTHTQVLASDECSLSHKYFKEDIPMKGEDAYYEAKGEFEDLLSDLEIPLPDDRSFSVPHQQRLPPIDIPKFNGNQSEWEAFRDLFKSIIHENEGVRDVDKFYYLKTLVSGKAQVIIKDFKLTSANYKLAWLALANHYENKRRLTNSNLHNLFSVKPMKNETSEALSQLRRAICTPLEVLKSIGRPTDQWEDIVVFLTAVNFDENTQRDWQKSLGDSKIPPTLDELNKFIDERLAILESLESRVNSSNSSQSQKKIVKVNSYQNVSDVKTPRDTTHRSCSICDQEHYIGSCPVFKNKEVLERKQLVISKRLCFNCLGSHQMKNCSSSKRCFLCKGKHHSLLHNSTSSKNVLVTRVQQPSIGHLVDKSSTVSSDVTEQSDTLRQSTSTSSDDSHSLLTSHFTSQSGSILLATALIKVQSSLGLTLTVRALIDPCSQASFVSESLIQRLRLKTRRVHVPIEGTGGTPLATANKLTEFVISPHFNSSFSTKVQALVLPRVSSYVPPSMRSSLSLPYLKGLLLADPQCVDFSHIDVLLGADVHALIVESEVIKGSPHEPIATKTTLGWLLSGNLPGKVLSNAAVTSLHICQDCNLDESIQKFWLQDTIPEVCPLTEEELSCEAHFVQTHSQNIDGRYVVRLPFKDGSPTSNCNLGDSLYPSKRMLLNMEKRFQIDSKLKLAYDEFLQEYENLGHMTHLSSLSEPLELKDHFFLPHHGVWKENSSSTKLRTVFNGSVKLQNGTSLNSLLHSGPNLLPHLLDIINAWRNYEFVFAADVNKMFRQILIHQDDRQYQNILWRYSSEDNIQIFQLNTVTYGLACSPFLANRTLKQLAKDLAFLHPLGAEVVNNEVYVDDILSGGHTVAEALSKRQDTEKLLSSAGFPLRKWASNSIDVLKEIPENHLAIESKSLSDASSNTTVLGLFWNSGLDEFSFRVYTTELPSKLTKRIVLSRISKVFDPLGWLSPIIIVAKILMQSLWLAKIGWDDELSANHRICYTKWENQLNTINGIRIPRWNNFSPQVDFVELHVFADASKEAYGAVAYLRVLLNSKINVTLLVSKSKVAPLKLLSIPRLELSAAHLATKLAKHLVKSSKFEFSAIHLWTDSMDVLFWLRGHPSRWPTFVANRCSAIHVDCPEAFWHHVRSKNNPADLVSRGCFAQDLYDNQLWWTGPDFLSKTQESWSTVLDTSITDELNKRLAQDVDSSQNNESQVTYSVTIQSYRWDFVNKYSSLDKLLRVLAYILKFIFNMLYKLKARLGSRFKSRLINLISRLDRVEYTGNTGVSATELQRSELVLVYLHQQERFSAEIRILSEGNRLPNKHPLLKLNPILDGEVLRVGGRLGNANLPYEQRHPLILMPKDSITRNIIKKVHLDTLHSGTQMTLGTLRLRYWVVNGRNAVKSVINKCFKCRRYGRLSSTQLMGQLPIDRVTPSPPFMTTGVDYAGPFRIRLSKSRGNNTLKGYVAIFVCFSTRAVHIELVEDYSSQAFIAAFHRFTARRGHCKDIFSDQGTTFVGADVELNRMFDGASSDFNHLSNSLSLLGTRWHFNPPGSPHFGGLWEAAVKSAKWHLRRVVGEQVLTFVELYTLLCRIEAVMNSRPLLPLTDDINDLSPLTPAHFLIHRSSFLVPENDYVHKNIPLGKRWELVAQMVQHYWNRWSNEYLTALQTRQKWLQPQRSYQVGDLVLIKKETTAPGHWPIGRVTAVHPGPDGLVRSVTVKTAQSLFQRPIVKLLLLSTVDELHS